MLACVWLTDVCVTEGVGDGGRVGYWVITFGFIKTSFNLVISGLFPNPHPPLKSSRSIAQTIDPPNPLVLT